MPLAHVKSAILNTQTASHTNSSVTRRGGRRNDKILHYAMLLLLLLPHLDIVGDLDSSSLAFIALRERRDFYDDRVRLKDFARRPKDTLEASTSNVELDATILIMPEAIQRAHAQRGSDAIRTRLYSRTIVQQLLQSFGVQFSIF